MNTIIRFTSTNISIEKGKEKYPLKKRATQYVVMPNIVHGIQEIFEDSENFLTINSHKYGIKNIQIKTKFDEIKHFKPAHQDLIEKIRHCATGALIEFKKKETMFNKLTFINSLYILITELVPGPIKLTPFGEETKKFLSFIEDKFNKIDYQLFINIEKMFIVKLYYILFYRQQPIKKVIQQLTNHFKIFEGKFPHYMSRWQTQQDKLIIEKDSKLFMLEDVNKILNDNNINLNEQIKDHLNALYIMEKLKN